MVILVDTNDRPLGQSHKMEAHHRGLLHRAYSVFIFNSAGQLLLQRRALGKYHSPGIWANTCCSHPGPEEITKESAVRRLEFEMGIKAELQFRDSFLYKSEVGKGLIEHEYDHIFSGVSDLVPRPDPGEVMDFRYSHPEHILTDIRMNPESYGVWFRIIFSQYYEQLQKWAE